MEALEGSTIKQLVDGFSKAEVAAAVELIEQPVRWELVYFYQANPFSIHTAQGLANIIGRRIDEVRREVRKLVEMHILTSIADDEDFPPIYAYEPDKNTAKLISKLSEICNAHRPVIQELCRSLKKE